MVFLLYLIVGNYYDLQITTQRGSKDITTLLNTMSLWGFLFGVIMEWKGLRRVLKGRYNLNWNLLIPTVILSILVFIPNIYWLKWFGVTQNILLNIIILPETHIILSVLAGTMLVRSFTVHENKNGY